MLEAGGTEEATEWACGLSGDEVGTDGDDTEALNEACAAAILYDWLGRSDPSWPLSWPPSCSKPVAPGILEAHQLPIADLLAVAPQPLSWAPLIAA